MKYVCKNPDCVDFGKEKEFFKTTTKFVGGELICSQSICGKCNKTMEDITVQIPLSEKNIYVAKIASMSKEGKVEVLKKRSKEHFKKEVKERKEHLMNSAIKEMKGK